MVSYPKISIITPSYNQGQYIEDTILSVINQNYPNLEYIIIDGGSTDNTIEIIKKYEKYLTYWVSEPDKGIYDAMNKGVEKATGEWFYFLGTDDVLCEMVLLHIFGNPDLIINKNFIYGNVHFKIANRLYGQAYDKTLLASRVICHQAIFTHSDLFRKYGVFNLRYKACADYALMIACFSDDLNKNLYINQTIAIYNEGGFSNSFVDKAFLRDKNKICLQYLGVKANKTDYYNYIGNTGLENLRKGNIKKGLKNIWLAFLHTNNKIYWLKNTIYWLKKYFQKKHIKI
jgi:glycosyltransferase involved in cell wall biosynthesis